MTLIATGCSNRSSAWLQRAQGHLVKGQDLKAQKVMEQGIKHSEDGYKALTQALAVYSVNRRTKAQEEMVRAVLADPRKWIGRDLEKDERVDLLYCLADISFREGRLANAITLCEECIKLAPDNPLIQNTFAYACAESDTRLKEALTLAEKAHYARPSALEITDTLAWVHFKLGHYKDALDIMSPVVKAGPDNATYRYHQGMILKHLGECDRARVELAKCLLLDPTMTEARKQLVNLKHKR